MSARPRRRRLGDAPAGAQRARDAAAGRLLDGRDAAAVLVERGPDQCRVLFTRRCPIGGCAGGPCARFETDDESRW